MIHSVTRCGIRSLAAAALAVLCACNSVTSVNTVQPEGSTPIPPSVVLRKTNFDASLAQGATVNGAYESRTPAGALRVQVQVANRSGTSETDFMWKCEWFDGKGVSIPGQNPQWTKVILLPGQETTVTLIAPNPEAVDWRLSMTRWQR